MHVNECIYIPAAQFFAPSPPWGEGESFKVLKNSHGEMASVCVCTCACVICVCVRRARTHVCVYLCARTRVSVCLCVCAHIYIQGSLLANFSGSVISL